jgi:tryptophan synthase alpha chain
VVEMGVPFSDPIADGPVIQRASERAMAAGGCLTATLALAAGARRKGLDAPLVLFSYANPVLAHGEETFARRAAEAGIDGVLVTDLPPEEGRPLARWLGRRGIDPIYLLAPTSTDARMRSAAALSRGFVYLVSRAGVTGVRASLPEDLPALVSRTRAAAPKLPIAIGFGIGAPEQAAAAARLAEGVVVGSAVVAAAFEAQERREEPVEAACAIVRQMAGALRAAGTTASLG